MLPEEPNPSKDDHFDEGGQKPKFWGISDILTIRSDGEIRILGIVIRKGKD